MNREGDPSNRLDKSYVPSFGVVVGGPCDRHLPQPLRPMLPILNLQLIHQPLHPTRFCRPVLLLHLYLLYLLCAKVKHS